MEFSEDLDCLRNIKRELHNFTQAQASINRQSNDKIVDARLHQHRQLIRSTTRNLLRFAS